MVCHDADMMTVQGLQHLITSSSPQEKEMCSWQIPMICFVGQAENQPQRAKFYKIKSIFKLYMLHLNHNNFFWNTKKQDWN